MKLKEIAPARLGVYLLGLLILGCGIDMNTKAGLGVSPVISVAYAAAQILDLPLGAVTFAYYCVLIGVQYVLLKGKLPPVQLLQFAVSLLTSLFIQLWDEVLPTAEALGAKVAMMFIAIALTGIGLSLTVGMRLIPNPADGLAGVIGDKIGRGLGTGKNLLDAVSVVLACVLGLVFRGRLLGIGVGTLAAVLLIGRVAALCQPHVARLYRKAQP
ncbi:MAG: hypothetical protein IJ617_05450 [Oscillospiraceae bacterium]|nr:hypothetical protein [Oscillospiraceae bacterium]